MDKSICSGGLRIQVWHTETTLLKKFSITKYNLSKSGVCDKTSNQRKSTILSFASILHVSPFSSSSLSTTVSCRRSRSTGPRRQPAKRKTQAVSNSSQGYMVSSSRFKEGFKVECIVILSIYSTPILLLVYKGEK